MTASKMQWKKVLDGWLSKNGKWRIRGPIMSKPMYWLIQTGVGRYTPTGKYEDVVSFTTLDAAKQYAETLG